MTTAACGAPAPSNAALKALIEILGFKKQVEVTENVASASLQVTSVHPMTGIPTTNTSIGFVGCARTICTQLASSVVSGGLWGQSLDDQQCVESWMEAASSTLVPVLQGAKSDPLFKAAVEEFAEKVEAFLFQNDQTFLVGDSPTACDVCAAIWLVQACEKMGVDKLPQQTFRWAMTIVHHEAVQKAVKLSKLPKEGSASPANKPPPPKAPAAASSSSGEFADNALVQKLVEFGIPHSVYAHKLSMTAEELVANVPVPDGDTHTKNLFLRDKKHGLFLVTVCTDAQVNTKELGKMLKLEGKVNLRLADEAILDSSLGVKRGCVGPLTIVNDKEEKVTLVLDKALLDAKNIHSHPLRNDASVKLTPKALQDYFVKVKREPVILEFGKVGGAAAPQETKKAPPPVEKKTEKKKAPAEKQDKKEKKQSENKKTAKKGETLLAVQWKKEENFAQWYSDVIQLSEMIAYYDISGCYILRPWSYKMWEIIQGWFNIKIAELGVENCYFPLFVSKDRLEKEKDHVEGFAPEVAWVTKSGDGDLAKPIAIRPTSETIMYPAYSDWIKSHRDLPLLLNQWSNVVRWEFKYPTPFLRSREFLWQEGHTAHVSLEDADKMVMEALELYRGVYEDLMAVPVIKGHKTEKEKFAGGAMTTTVEAYVPISGRAIQGATSHNLGQNFGKMFDIKFQDHEGKTQIAWQTSWGLTTRTIGVMIMVHGDDTGLVLPPRMAPLQAVIVPITNKKFNMDQVAPYCQDILADLKSNGIRAKFDDREMYNPGWKYNHWEQKGVPLRIEVGPRDIEQKQTRIVVRYSGDKVDMPVEGLGAALKTKLDEIQAAMFQKAKAFRDDHLVKVTEWKDFVPELEKHNLVLTPWCGGEHQDWEEWVKDKSREESLASRGEEAEDTRTSTSVAAKTLCIPFDQPELPEGTKCIASGMVAKCWVLWGRSY